MRCMKIVMTMLLATSLYGSVVAQVEMDGMSVAQVDVPHHVQLEREINHELMEEYMDWKADYEEEKAEMIRDGVPVDFIDGNYYSEVTYQDDHYVSIIEQHWEYFGGAHPEIDVDGYVYDLSAGEKVDLAEYLGMSEVDIRDRLVPLTIEAVVSQRDDELDYGIVEDLMNGIVIAVQENDLPDFILDENGQVDVFYAPYEVASGSFGTIWIDWQ